MVRQTKRWVRGSVLFEGLEPRVLLSATALGTVGRVAANLVAFHNALYFTAGDGSHGDQLWKTDGTAAGTVMVKDINPAPIANATISTITVVGDKLLFGANDGTNGTQIWVSDGTAAGTQPVTGTSLGVGQFPTTLPVVDGSAYFVSSSGGGFSIWKTDGTTGGTMSLAALPTDETSFANPVLIGDRLYVVGNSFSGGLPFNSLYSFNAGDLQFTTVVPLSETKTITDLTDAEGVAYYYTGSLTHLGLDLERFDPAGGRVHIVTTVTNPATSTNFPGMAEWNGNVYFTADDAGTKSRLFVTNGTTAGTHVVDATVGLRPLNLQVAGGKLYYFAQSGGSFHLFTTNGTMVTALATVPPTSDQFSTAVDFKGRLVFAGIGNSGDPDLWISDGTVAGTKKITSLAGITPPNPSHTWTYRLRELELLGNELIIRSQPDGVDYQLFGVDLSAFADLGVTGGLDVTNHFYVTGHARDLNVPNGDVNIRVEVDGDLNTIFTATTVDPVNGRSFKWYTPVLNRFPHTIDFFAISSVSEAKTKIGTFTLQGDGTLFDQRWYLAKYPDVAAAVKSGKLRNGFQHFAATGDREGRDPSPFFDTTFYLQMNPDVAAAVKQGKIVSGWDHFRLTGEFEKRDPSPFFNTAYYLAQNPDVAQRVAASRFSAYEHFVFTGQYERRDITSFFSQNSYWANNPDIHATVSTGSLSSAMTHFILTGQKENRPYTAPSPFNETAYLAANPDVAAAVAAGTIDSGLEHFLWTGQKDGRSPTG